MRHLPVLAQYIAAPPSVLVQRAMKLAEELRTQQPGLIPSDAFRRLIPATLDDAPALHLDDLSTIVQLDRFYDVAFLEDRARFRAMHGDIVATCAPATPAFEDYCETHLGLGHVKWLRPHPGADSLAVASACWTDRGVRRSIVHACRQDRLRYVHPHIGNFPAWALAQLIQRASRRPVHVIAPPPGLTQRVNNKLWFSDTVRRLFDQHAIPRTAAAYSLVTAAHLVRQMAPRSRILVFKLPSSAGGAGNLVVDSRSLRDRQIGSLRGELRKRLARLEWTGEGPVLVGAWETEVLGAPSTQLWIPPESDGLPIVEGVFQQLLEGAEGEFTGCCAASFPPAVTQDLVDRSWVLGRLFQRLGYVGRCSFDLILVGPSLDACRAEFIECNGRWGGTSLPMTLMNRLFGNWTARPYATSEYSIAGLSRFTFADLLAFFGDDVFDIRTGTGSVIPYNPGALASRSGIDILVLGETWDTARHRAEHEIPRQLEQLARTGRVASGRWAQIR